MSHHDYGDDAPGGVDDPGYTPRHGSGYAEDDGVEADRPSSRNVGLAVGLSVVAVVMVILMFWLMSSLTGSRPEVDAKARVSTTTTSATTTSDTIQAVAPETSVTVPSIGTYTPSTTYSLPPPELPTATLAQPVVTPAPAPTTTQAPAPAPQPPAPPTPAGPSISNVKFTCTKAGGNKINGTLSFTTTTPASAAIAAGDAVQTRSGGPGDVSVTASGRGNPICIAKINDQVLGPIPAS